MSTLPCVHIRRATRIDKPVVAEMLQSYLHDMMPFINTEPDSTGNFAYPYFDLYWSPEGVAEGRIPYLIMVEKAVAGFAFINRHSRLHTPDTCNIAEFYVKDGWRRNGVGKNAVDRIFNLHPGRWEIAVLQANAPAFEFWTSVVDELAGGVFTVTETDTEIWDGSVIQLEI